MAETKTRHRQVDSFKNWQALAGLALSGLRKTYGDDPTGQPHTMRWNGRLASPEGTNTRYTLIALLGLARAKKLLGSGDDLSTDLWNRVGHAFDSIAHSPGDLGLGLWARALHVGGHQRFTAECALHEYRARRNSCDSVDLAWLLLGADHALLADIESPVAERLADEAKTALLRLYNPETKLFYRHGRDGLFSGVSRRVACFANQIYPVMALAVHARRTGCRQSAAIGQDVANNLCRLQGPLGQWWWLYDAKRGPIVDGYPVFSVHQDGMAPMALMETSAAGGRSYTREIDRGLSWIFGENELDVNLVLSDEGVVLRDIHRAGIGRIKRMIGGTMWCLGWRHGSRVEHPAGLLVVNNECRPYHLGWILYAAGLMSETANGKGT